MSDLSQRRTFKRQRRLTLDELTTKPIHAAAKSSFMIHANCGDSSNVERGIAETSASGKSLVTIQTQEDGDGNKARSQLETSQAINDHDDSSETELTDDHNDMNGDGDSSALSSWVIDYFNKVDKEELLVEDEEEIDDA